MLMSLIINIFYSFFFNDTATTEIYTLSLHDALPICGGNPSIRRGHRGLPSRSALDTEKGRDRVARLNRGYPYLDRKSTRLNSSHANISYAVFCLKKKK